MSTEALQGQRLLFIHSSAELYGSDKSLRSITEESIRRGARVTVVLPELGPLGRELKRLHAEVLVLPVAVLRRSIVRPRGFFRFLTDLLGSRSVIRMLRDDNNGVIRVISNTSAVLTGAIVARSLRAQHTWIVREIYKPGLELVVFRRLLGTAAKLVCVSEAVARQFRVRDLRGVQRRVVYSGADLRAGTPSPIEFSPEDRAIHILCPGRLNDWKGQDVLIRAVASLPRAMKVCVRIVGGEYGGATATTRMLEELISALNLSRQIELVGELNDLDAEYEWSDLVVVPSKRAEPFGKVVIEAMNRGRCVIATNLGGPAEVITDQVNGLLVPANDPCALRDAIVSLADQRVKLVQLGDAAFERSLRFDARRSAADIVDFVVDESERS